MTDRQTCEELADLQVAPDTSVCSSLARGPKRLGEGGSLRCMGSGPQYRRLLKVTKLERSGGRFLAITLRLRVLGEYVFTSLEGQELENHEIYHTDKDIGTIPKTC